MSSEATYSPLPTSGIPSSTLQRKVPKSILLVAACILGVGLGLFAINYYHTSNCPGSDGGNEATKDFMVALNRRLLESESRIIKNENMMHKIIHIMETNLQKLEEEQYDYISKTSEEEAVKIGLYLATHPAPIFPEFVLNENSMEGLADVVDDVFSKEDFDDKEFKLDFANPNAVDFVDDQGKDGERPNGVSSISDAEARIKCNEWKTTYHVEKGVSWGELPYDLQQQWLEYACDYHLDE